MLKMDSSLWNICNENPIGSPRLNLLRSTRNQSHSDGNIFVNQPFDLCRPPEQDLQFTAVKDQEPTDLTTTSGDPQWRAWNGRSTPEENRRKRKRPLALTQRFARFYHEDDGLDLPRWTDTEIETEQTREDGQGISRTTGDSEEIKDAEYSDYVSDEILEVHERCTKPPSSDQENGDSDSDVKEVLANLEPHVPSFVMQSVSSNMEEIVSKLRASNSSESNSPDVENDFGRKIFELLKEHKEKIGQAASFQNPKKKNSSLISSFSINSLQIGESRNSPVMDEPQGANSPGERFNAVEHTIYESPELKPSTSYSCEQKTMDTSGEHSKQDNFLAPSRPPLKKPLNEKKQLINSLPDQPQINIVPGPSRTPDGIDTFMAFSESIKIAKSLWLTDKVEPIDLFRRWLPNFNFNCLGSTEQPSPNNSHKDRTSGSVCSNANGEQTEAISLVVNKKQNEHLSTPIVDTPQDEDLCDRSPNSRIPYILPSSVYTGFQVAKKRRTKVTDTRLGIRNNIKSHPEMFNGPSTSQENLPVPTNFESDEGESCGTISHFNNQLWRACEQNNKRLFTEFPKSTAPKMHSRNTIMSPISSRLSQQSESLTNHNPDITNAVTLNTSEPESFSPRVLPLAGHTEPANHPMNQNTASTEENQMRLNNFVTQDFLQRALSSALRQVPAPNQAFPTFMRALNTLGTPPDANSETHFVRPFAPPAAFINMPALSNMPDKLPYLRTSTVAAGEDCALERIPSSGISHQQFNRYNTVQDRRCLNGSILSSVTSCRQYDADTDGLRLTSTLTPVHLRKAKLMFFYTRYPNSNLIKMYFPDVKFYKNNTAQLVKWFSNFREFYYIQMEKYARVAISEGIRCAEDIHVSTDSELYRALNMHYNRNQQLEVPEHFRVVVQATLREFFIALRNGKDAEQSWKKPIYKIIARMDQPVPEFFKNPNWMEQLADS